MPKYPYIKLTRTVKEQMDPRLVKGKVIKLLNDNPQVSPADIKGIVIALDRLSEHAPSDKYDAIYSKYITLQKSRKE